ncbi:oxidoreductase [Pseudoalteromonas luteoviolacea]|uniref:Oxidoreductase n=1 Tax=Pseudoalteromonas luteoviolacea TaxID=43657 RepID=A0A1C0TL15_9GAMM|nr:SDR family NAD(P)-dependent oxidoreductase [Pseudoalteromonas luteoviolacea]OCQ19183.1 oxidoreductase [Pseudoalteromonas luteoviolacea]
MKKTILITGSTDGIGLATAKTMLSRGHCVLLHGRSQNKLESVYGELSAQFGQDMVYRYRADLSIAQELRSLVAAVRRDHDSLDVLINNAGVFNIAQTVSADNLDVRFMVNTIAPFILTEQLLELLNQQSRIVNLSSAAQAPFSAEEITKPSALSNGAVYAKSKLALTMWSAVLGEKYKASGPMIVAVNPKSFLGSKMVQEAYGMQGSSVQQGADILVEAALADSFAQAGGLYFDNDIGQFSAPHNAASDPVLANELMTTLASLSAQLN